MCGMSKSMVGCRATDWCVLLFALGLMSKPMLVTLPFVLLLLDYWPLNRLRAGACRWQSRLVDGREIFLFPCG